MTKYWCWKYYEKKIKILKKKYVINIQKFLIEIIPKLFYLSLNKKKNLWQVHKIIENYI